MKTLIVVGIRSEAIKMAPLINVLNLGNPVLVTREVTERPEAIATGTSRMVDTNQAAIVGEAAQLLDDADAYAAMVRAEDPYGDGTASQRIWDTPVNAC